jgi:hypothetical protein
VAIAALVLGLAPACSNGNGSGQGATCPGGFDASGQTGGTQAIAANGQCAGLATGTKQNGEACQQSSECAATCCACPSGGRSAQVAWCSGGTCIVSAEACCEWIAGNAGIDGGAPFVCTSH